MPRPRFLASAFAALLPSVFAPALALANPVLQRFPGEAGTGIVQGPISTKLDSHFVQLVGTGIRVLRVEPTGCPTVEAVFPGDGKTVPSLASPGAGNARVYFLAIRGGVPGVSFLATDAQAPNGLRLLETLAFDQPIGVILARPDGADFVVRYVSASLSRLSRVDGDVPVDVPDSDAKGNNFILVGQTIYFANGGPLRKLEGDAVTNAADGDTVDRLVAGCGGRLYYAKAAIPGGKSAELWALDSAGNRSLGMAPPGSPTACLGERLLFTASDPATGLEPWISDGTAAGTKLLSDLTPGTANGFPRRWLATPDGLSAVILADAGVFRTDGTPAGTLQVADVGGFVANPGLVAPLGGETGAFLFRSADKLGKLGTSGPLTVLGDAGMAPFVGASSFHAGRYFARTEHSGIGSQVWSFDPAAPVDAITSAECTYPAIVPTPGGGGGAAGAGGAGQGGAGQAGASGQSGNAGANAAGNGGASGEASGGDGGTSGSAGDAGKGGNAPGGKGGAAGKSGSSSASGGNGAAGADIGKGGSKSGAAGRAGSAGAPTGGSGGKTGTPAPAAAPADDGGCSVISHDDATRFWPSVLVGVVGALAMRRRRRVGGA